MANWNCCEREFKTLKSYLVHLKHHENIISLLTCNICEFYCKNYTQFKKHYNSKHKDHILNLMLHDAAYEEMEVEDNKNEKNECNYCIEII